MVFSRDLIFLKKNKGVAIYAGKVLTTCFVSELLVPVLEGVAHKRSMSKNLRCLTLCFSFYKNQGMAAKQSQPVPKPKQFLYRQKRSTVIHAAIKPIISFLIEPLILDLIEK